MRLNKRLLYLLAIPLTASAVFLQVKYVNADSNTCFAPCVVVFPDNMEEDELYFDYTSDKEFKVWRATKANMESR